MWHKLMKEEARDTENQEPEFTVEELQQLEERLANNLMGLSKNASKNQVSMQRTQERLHQTSALLDEAIQAQARANAAALQPQINELLGQQDSLVEKINRMATQPSKYATELADLGKQARAIDKKIAELKNEY